MDPLKAKLNKGAIRVLQAITQVEREEIFDAWPKDYLEEFFCYCLELEEYEVCGYITEYRREL